jgi:hypothetical protein
MRGWRGCNSRALEDFALGKCLRSFASFVHAVMFAADTAQTTDREMKMASRRSFELTPPSFVVFVISVILALAAVLVHYGHIAIPLIGAAHVFDVLLAGYVVMLIGVLFKGV